MADRHWTIRTSSEEDTIRAGRELAADLHGVVLLTGDLGAGKTTLVRGIVAGIQGTAAQEVSSPTFTLIHDYGAGVFHVDLYRLDHEREIDTLGLDDIFAEARLVLVEWGEKLGARMPAERTEIRIEQPGEDERLIHITAREYMRGHKAEEKAMLPGLAQLENTPELFRILLFGLSDEEASWKPAPDRWSIAEVIEHLSHVEAHVFRARIDQMVQETLPEIKDYDQDALAADGQYSRRDIEDSFDHWEDQRDSNVEYLRTLKDDLLTRQGRHEKLGIVTAGEVLNAWAFHDLGHLRQVIEILRAFRHFPKMGPFQSNYRIHP